MRANKSARMLRPGFVSAAAKTKAGEATSVHEKVIASSNTDGGYASAILMKY